MAAPALGQRRRHSDQLLEAAILLTPPPSPWRPVGGEGGRHLALRTPVAMATNHGSRHFSHPAPVAMAMAGPAPLQARVRLHLPKRWVRLTLAALPAPKLSTVVE